MIYVLVVRVEAEPAQYVRVFRKESLKDFMDELTYKEPSSNVLKHIK